MENVYQKINFFNNKRVLIGLACFLLLSDSPEPHQYKISPHIEHSMNNGDLIFRLGKGYWSPLISKLSPMSGMSHVGVLIKESDEWKVIHADADDHTLIGSVMETSLEQFITESIKITIKKNNMAPSEKALFLSNLTRMASIPIQFDEKFTLDDNGEKVYCTEMIWVASKNNQHGTLGSVSKTAGHVGVSIDSIYQSNILENLLPATKVETLSK